MVYAGFRDARRDIQDPPEAQSARASPDPHDEEYLEARPNQEEMEDAINKFLVQLEKPERNGFKDLASVLSQLPKPAQGSATSLSVADAIEAGFLPALDKDQANMFTPSELLLGYPRISRDNLHSTRISLDIPGYPWSPFRLVKSGDVHTRLSQVNLGWTSPELFMSCPKDELHQWYLKLSQVVLCYFDLSHIVIGICWDNRYLGLFGDHIVPAILYRYTSELTRPDLVNAKGKPLITKARLKAVWTRLANRLATVVADTSMVTISPQYATHFYEMYINGKENAKLTGDRMKILMLSLPFMVRDLIQPEVEVNWDILVYTDIYSARKVISCVMPG